MHSPRCRNSCSWRKMFFPSEFCRITLMHQHMHTDRMGRKRKRCKFLFCLSAPSPLRGNGMLQTLSGLGSLELCEPHPATPAAPSCVRAIPGWKKAYFLLLNNIL